MMAVPETTWDCVVVGGGAAGLSAALVLGRARQRTLVIDAGTQSNLPAHGIGGLLGHDGRPPAELYALARKELASYPSVHVREGRVSAAEASDEGFVLQLEDGTSETAKRLLLAGGMDYRYADVPGVEQRWGRSVFHCPFCHGWEVRDQLLGLLDSGSMAVQGALLLRMWSDDVTVFSNGPAGLEPDESDLLQKAGIAVDERPVAELIGPGDTLTAIKFADGEERACDGLLAPVKLHQRSPLAEALGVETAQGQIAVDAIQTDPMCQTNVPGVFAAGDITGEMPSVANAIALGSKAAAAIVRSLALP